MNSITIRDILMEEIREKRQACPHQIKTKRPWRTKLPKNEPRTPDLLRVLINK